MGGNLFRDLGVSRMDDDRYIKVTENLSNMLLLGGVDLFRFPEFVREKKSHGDVDIIVPNTCREAVRVVMGGYPLHKNGPVDSYFYEYHQVDFVYVSPDVFEYAFAYFSWNDLGNLVGRIAHKMGLKHGHDGLKMVVRDGTNVLGEIVLTRDYRVAMRFLGFSVDRFEQGFDTFEDVYKFVSDHPRFSPRIFDLDNRNHIARVRDKKRPTYTNFLKWIDQNRGYLSDYSWPDNKEVWLVSIFESFPSAKDEWDALWEASRRKELAKSKLNGSRISELTGLQGKELGRFIQVLKELHPDWIELACASTQEEVDSLVVKVQNTISWTKEV